MTGQLIPPGAPEFVDLFETFDVEAFNLETLQDYSGAGEDADFNAFLAGDRPPGGHDAWLDMVRRNTAAGRAMRRVHIVLEPLGDYMRYELSWPYAACSAAGEDIRIVPVRGRAPRWVKRLPGDSWLFDSTRLYRQHHGADGRWLGTEAVADPAAADTARRRRDELWAGAVPWADYVKSWPDLAARVPTWA